MCKHFTLSFFIKGRKLRSDSNDFYYSEDTIINHPPNTDTFNLQITFQVIRK